MKSPKSSLETVIATRLQTFLTEYTIKMTDRILESVFTQLLRPGVVRRGKTSINVITPVTPKTRAIRRIPAAKAPVINPMLLPRYKNSGRLRANTLAGFISSQPGNMWLGTPAELFEAVKAWFKNNKSTLTKPRSTQGISRALKHFANNPDKLAPYGVAVLVREEANGHHKILLQRRS